MHRVYLLLYGKYLLPKNDATKRHPNYMILVSMYWVIIFDIGLSILDILGYLITPNLFPIIIMR